MESFVPQQQDEPDPAATFRAKVLRSGLDPVRCEARHLSYAFDNANALAASLRAVNPFLGRLRGGERERAEYVARLVGECAGASSEKAAARLGAVATAQ